MFFDVKRFIQKEKPKVDSDELSRQWDEQIDIMRAEGFNTHKTSAKHPMDEFFKKYRTIKDKIDEANRGNDNRVDLQSLIDIQRRTVK